MKAAAKAAKDAARTLAAAEKAAEKERQVAARAAARAARASMRKPIPKTALEERMTTGKGPSQIGALLDDDDDSLGDDEIELVDIAVALVSDEGDDWSPDAWNEEESDELQVPGVVEDTIEDGSDDEGPVTAAKKKKTKAKAKAADEDDDEDEEDEELLVRPLSTDEIVCSSCFLIVPRRRIADAASRICSDCG